MRKNLLMIVLLLGMLLFSTGAALADGHGLPEPFCGDLSDDDCDFLFAAQEAGLQVSSYTSSVDATTVVAGIPGLPADELVFEWGQDAVIEMDPEIVMNMIELQMGGAEAMMENMDDLVTATVDFYRTLGVDTVVDFTMPAEIADALSAQAGIEIPEAITVQLVMKDGFAYIATEDLAFIDPSIPDMGAWLGIDMAGAVEMGFAQSMDSDDPAQQAAMAQSFGFSSLLNSEEVRGLLADFVTVERLDDDAVDGTDVAVFENGFDFAGFLASPGFWELVRTNLDLINEMGDTQLTEAELQQAQTAMTFLGPALLQGLQLNSTTSLGTEDLFPYAQTVNFSWDLASLLSFAASTGAVPAGSPAEALVSLQIDAVNGDFNSADEIEAPEDATIIPLEGMEAE
jgi:hypothetical protein